VVTVVEWRTSGAAAPPVYRDAGARTGPRADGLDERGRYAAGVASDDELVQAREAARHAEAEAGQLRGEIVELKTQLARARQDQESYQRLLDARRSAGARWARTRRWLGTQRRRFR